SKRVLSEWFTISRSTDFRDLNHVKGVFGPKHIDLVHPWTIVDIGSNKYRLVLIVKYRQRRIYIRHVFTHKEYDNWNKRQRDKERRGHEKLVREYEALRASKKSKRGPSGKEEKTS
ncbi:MAG: type II toxin-antitoxin system HigB family toxin, partial [Planctomycetota bacterium]